MLPKVTEKSEKKFKRKVLLINDKLATTITKCRESQSALISKYNIRSSKMYISIDIFLPEQAMHLPLDLSMVLDQIFLEDWQLLPQWVSSLHETNVVQIEGMIQHSITDITRVAKKTLKTISDWIRNTSFLLYIQSFSSPRQVP